MLYVLDETCEGPELDCPDDTEAAATSRLVVDAAQGQQLLVVVDGSAGATGNAVLNINAVDCPGADLSEVPLPDTFTNAAAPNDHASACGGDGGLERTFRYTPTEAGLYSFKASSTEMQPIVDLELGPVCGGPELQCNYTAHPGGSEVRRGWAAGIGRAGRGQRRRCTRRRRRRSRQHHHPPPAGVSAAQRDGCGGVVAPGGGGGGA